jgi:hypothetical protein
MSKGMRISFLAVSLGLLLLLGLVFRQFVLESILLPAATVVWLFLRIFVLSIDQEVFWWALIALSVIVIFRPLFRGSTAPLLPCFIPSAAQDRAGPWRRLILGNTHVAAHEDTLRRELVWQLTALYSSQRPGEAKFQIREAFLDGRIPLPESIFTFLFPSPPPPASFFRRKRARRDASDYMRSVDEVLSFMETSMERGHEIHSL